MKCKNCGKYFDPSNNGQVALRQFHCSKKCSMEWNRKTSKYKLKIQKPKKCCVCGKEFIPRNSLVKYCSYKCSNSIKYKQFKESIIKKCNHCGKEFKPYRNNNNFCSSDCRIKNIKSKRSFNWNKESIDKRMGKNNPCYRNGNFTQSSKRTFKGLRLFTKNALEIEQEMIEKYGFKFCEECKISNPISFERHHIIFRSEKPNHINIHDKRNILILCLKCHNEFHKHKGKRNKIVIERKLHEIFGNDVLDKQSKSALDCG